MLTRRALLAVLASLPALAACEQDDHDHHRKPGDDVTPTPTPIPEPPAPTPHEVEFRVTGPFQGAVRVTVSDSQEGTTTLVTELPWFASFKTTRVALFLSIEVRAAGVGDIQAQIFVDGVLFRQATASGVDPQAAISGNWAA